MDRRTNSTNCFLVISTGFRLRITFCPSLCLFMLVPLTYWVYVKRAVLRTDSCSRCFHYWTLSGHLCCFRHKEICLSKNAHMLPINQPGFDCILTWFVLVGTGSHGHTARAPFSTPFIRLLPPTAVMPVQNVTGISCCAQMRLVCSCSATWGYHVCLFIFRSPA